RCGGVSHPEAIREANPHGSQMLIDADVLRGRTVTSWPAIQTDVRNAGGYWVDEEVVVDTGLVTSRKPDDIPAFNAIMIEEFAEGIHRGQQQKSASSSAEQQAARAGGPM